MKWKKGLLSSRLLRINFVLPVHQIKQVAESSDSFCRTHHQETRGLQGVVKKWNQFLLKRCAQINQNIATTEQVHAGKRWVACQIMPGKNAQVANGLDDFIALVRFGKEVPEAPFPNIRCDFLRVFAGPGLLDCLLVDIRPEDFNGNIEALVFQIFQQTDC